MWGQERRGGRDHTADLGRFSSKAPEPGVKGIGKDSAPCGLEGAVGPHGQVLSSTARLGRLTPGHLFTIIIINIIIIDGYYCQSCIAVSSLTDFNSFPLASLVAKERKDQKAERERREKTRILEHLVL